MKCSIYKILVTSFCLAVLTANSAFAQELMIEIPLHVQVASSDLIIEGKVISKSSVWDTNEQNIYTINSIEVYKQFKGQNVSEQIDLITPGGTVGSDIEIVTPSLNLNIGDLGIFMLHGNSIAINNGSLSDTFQPVAAAQGFYKYDLKNNTAYNSFTARQGIVEVFYNDIRSLSEQTNILEIIAFDVNAMIETNQLNRNGNGIFEISDFSPTTLNAGVRDVLTVNGNGFGNTPGTVEFRDANFGGTNNMGPVYIAALEGQIISWNNTEILVEVPSRAGTGDIRVIPAFGAPILSSQTLTVFFAQINPSSDTNAFETQHFDSNGIGGYTWQMHTEFDANILASDAFLRAFDSWVCTTGINWDIGPVTPVDVIAGDGINIIRFDNGDELPQGILGRTSSRFNSCENQSSPGGIDITVVELDIVFNDAFTGSLSSISWEFGPSLASSAEVDFETVAVHELGHAHQLAHIINPGDIMHFSTSIAQNSRNLGASDLAGGNDIMDRNVTDQICDEGLMTYSECSALSISESQLDDVISVYPNPVKNLLTISTASSLTLDNLIIYDIRGRQVKSLSCESSNRHTIDVSALQAGVYLINISANNRNISKRLIIE